MFRCRKTIEHPGLRRFYISRCREINSARSITHPSLPNYTATRDELLTTANELFAMVSSGKIRADVTAEYALRDAPQEHADLEARKTTRAIVLVA
jgi:NADPH:quinone reductase-like Zn-dependent oxidoreductase